MNSTSISRRGFLGGALALSATVATGCTPGVKGALIEWCLGRSQCRQARPASHAVRHSRGQLGGRPGAAAGLQGEVRHRPGDGHPALRRPAAEGLLRVRQQEPLLRHRDRRHPVGPGPGRPAGAAEPAHQQHRAQRHGRCRCRRTSSPRSSTTLPCTTRSDPIKHFADETSAAGHRRHHRAPASTFTACRCRPTPRSWPTARTVHRPRRAGGLQGHRPARTWRCPRLGTSSSSGRRTSPARTRSCTAPR